MSALEDVAVCWVLDIVNDATHEGESENPWNSNTWWHANLSEGAEPIAPGWSDLSLQDDRST